MVDKRHHLWREKKKGRKKNSFALLEFGERSSAVIL
jgi:hypothetical protein